ncbi:MAG: hypothetical protein WC421_09305 [Elusimicrobiales bacterium]
MLFAEVASRRLAAFAAGLLAAVCVFMAALETRAPYYFLQDDNRDQFLACHVHAYRAAARGEIAQFNFHQFLGIPAAGCGGILYPPAAASVWASEKIFGHYWAAIDVLAAFHLLVGGLGAFVFASSLGLGAAPAAFFALSWIFCPFVVFAGASWWLVGLASAWFPWLMHGVWRLRARRDFMAAVEIVVSTAALFLMNHPQYPLYGCVVAVIFAFFAGDKKDWKFWTLLAASLAAGVMLAMPAILPQWDMMRQSAQRAHSLGFTEFNTFNLRVLQWFKGLFWPFSPQPSGGLGSYAMDKLSFLGYIPLVLIPFALRRAREDRKPLIFAGMAAFCLLWAAGGFGWYEFLVPPFNRLRWHFKILFFADFFLLLLAACAMARLRKTAAWALTALHALSMLAFYHWGPRAVFRLHTDEIPAREELASAFSGGRVAPLDWPLAAERGIPGLLFDYAQLFELNQFSGYDTLVPARNSEETFNPPYTGTQTGLDEAKLARLRLWGARWHILPPSALAKNAGFFARHGLKLFAATDERLVFEDVSALPLFYNEQTRLPAGRLRVSGNAVSARLADSSGGCYIANWLFQENFSASGGVRLSRAPQGQTRVCADRGVAAFEIRYSNPYLTYGFAAALLALLTLLPLIYKNTSKREGEPCPANMEKRS